MLTVAGGMQDATAIRRDFPLTLRHVGDGLLDAFLAQREEPTFLAFVQRRFSEGSIPHRGVRDLAKLEAERARLAALPPLAAPDAPLRDEAKLVLNPSLALIMYGADLTGMVEALREKRPATPKPRRAWLLLLPLGQGRVEERTLTRDDEGWLLEWFRTPTAITAVMPMWDAEREPFERLWQQGYLVEA